jgi:hypothetical protein
MKMRYFSYTLIFVLFTSCNEQDLFSSGNVPQKVISNSTQLFNGEITETSTSNLDGIDVWKVALENQSGAVVTFYWHRKNNMIFRIIGEQGPFDYELKPPLNTLVLSTAKFLAFESYSKEQLESWQLLRDSQHNLKWVYHFYLRGQQQPISINAASGDVM